MNNFNLLKKELGYFFVFPFLQPTEEQLNKIALEVHLKRPKDLGGLNAIVSKICPDVSVKLLEGVDNSDLRTLIELATAIAQKGRS